MQELLAELSWDNVRLYFEQQGKKLAGDWFEK